VGILLPESRLNGASPMISVSAIFAMIRHSFIAFGLVLSIFGAGGVEVSAQTPTIESEEQLMVKMINDYRAQRGLSQLKISIALTRAADWMSTDMSIRNYFSHTDSQGRDPFARMTAYGYNYTGFRGENLAAGYSDVERTFNQWKNSPSHNTNMLKPEFRVIGISRVYGGSSLYKWYWTTDFGSFIDATFGTQNVRTVNAASYSQSIAPDAIVATFGSQLTQSTTSASSVPLPTSMGGINITINGTPAQLLFVSPSQINYVVPASVAAGVASVRVSNNGNEIAGGTVNVEYVSPSIFTFAGTGNGTPAGQTTFDGVSFQSVANPDGTPRALSVGTTSKPNFLILYGTGLRRRSSLSGARVTIGGLPAQITYLGAHPGLAGLDQANIRLPLELRGRGIVDVVVSVDGRAANTVRINIGN
jgi:uncharacterized protein (TIGR03437 family)